MTAVIVTLVPETDLWLAWDWLQRGLGITLVCSAGIATYVIGQMVCGTRLADLRAPAVR